MRSGVCCSVLQCVAVYCSVLQCLEVKVKSADEVRTEERERERARAQREINKSSHVCHIILRERSITARLLGRAL